jgi:hypothetical protein
MKYIFVKLLKNYGSFLSGQVVRYGESKGRPIIQKGIGVEVSEGPAVNEPLPVKKTPVVETASMDISTAEKAVITPVKVEKKRGKN